MKQSFLVFGALTAVAGLSQASSIIDDFSSYTPGANMNGATPPIINGIVQPSWVVTNGAGVGGDNVIASDAFTGGAGRAVVGGWEPVTPGIVSLSSTVNVTLADLSTVPTTFAIDVVGFNSTNAGSAAYTIGLNSTAGNLLTISLTPIGGGGFTVGYSSGQFAPNFAFGVLSEGAPTQFQLETFFVSAGTVGFNLTNAGIPMASGTLASADETDFITGLSIDMIPQGPLAGDGFLLVDNVTLIPEPSTALLGLVSAAFFFTRRRR